MHIYLVRQKPNQFLTCLQKAKLFMNCLEQTLCGPGIKAQECTAKYLTNLLTITPVLACCGVSKSTNVSAVVGLIKVISTEKKGSFLLFPNPAGLLCDASGDGTAQPSCCEEMKNQSEKSFAKSY